MPLPFAFAGARVTFNTSYPAKAGYPVRRSFSAQGELLWDTGSPAFAGDDDLGMSRPNAETGRPNSFAPSGASRCRALASGFGNRSADRKESLSESGAVKPSRQPQVKES